MDYGVFTSNSVLTVYNIFTSYGVLLVYSVFTGYAVLTVYSILRNWLWSCNEMCICCSAHAFCCCIFFSIQAVVMNQ